METATMWAMWLVAGAALGYIVGRLHAFLIKEEEREYEETEPFVSEVPQYLWDGDPGVGERHRQPEGVLRGAWRAQEAKERARAANEPTRSYTNASDWLKK